MTEHPKWVDLREAIRTVVRLMPDGDRLADFMSEKWIVAGGDAYTAADDDYKDGKNPWMTARYGEEWQETRKKVREAYDFARSTLKGVLSRCQIAGEGQCDGEMGRRLITEREWEDGIVSWRDGRLLSQRDLPALNHVLLKAAAVKLECTRALEASRPEMLAVQIAVVATSATPLQQDISDLPEQPQEEWLGRKEAARYLATIGYPVKPKTLDNWAAKNNALGGPP
jgi:hypothetical protein